MSIVPNVQPLASIAGTVSLGTVTGDVLHSAPYEASDGAPVADALLGALELTWRSLPEVIASYGPNGRFDFVITQGREGSVPVPTLWDSGLSSSALCGAVARKLLKLRMHVYGTHAHRAPAPKVQQPQPALEVTELELDAIEWVPPARVDHAEQVRQQLHAVIHGLDPWAGVRS